MSDITRQTNSPLGIGKRTYERGIWGLVGIGCLGLLAGIVFGQQLIGTATYLVAVWAAVLAAVSLPYISDAKLSDERDEQLHNHASGLTIGIAFMVGISIIPAVYVLDAGNYITISATAWGAIFLFSALGLLYGACYTVVSRRA
ncbi:DUF2178 domain-containing protein [Natronolimnobius sp. AArcel1]|uniref:DUF2178 domain-containing protein n=1 Tax=Natronolimnobius sp. AArcel1 TaxID=1679093 RepID=UPI0013ED526D|nr:DUF2178 domain-containing protein [Natronolimnobius sp. AArcel1]NGM68238.1 DUF2178 domain-containing protein [Natronolimnobius sp. AArcel1]